MSERKPCPKCGEIVSTRHMHLHVCMTLDVESSIGRVLKDSANPEYAISERMYARIARALELPGLQWLKSRFGSYAALCAHFGLAISPAGARARARKPRPQTRSVLDGPPFSRVDVQDTYELPVCRQQTSTHTYQHGGLTVRHTETRSMIR